MQGQGMRVAVRARGGVDLGVMSLSDFVERLSTDVRERRDVVGAA